LSRRPETKAKGNAMLLNAFTVFHVVLSLIGIGAGVVAIYALIQARTLPGWTRLFLATTAATSVTGFFFPFHGFTPALALGVMSLIVLLIVSLALYRHRLLGAWWCPNLKLGHYPEPGGGPTR
jgi:hypothetical protein